MKIVSKYTTPESTETHRGKGVDAYDAQSTPVASGTPFSWYASYPEPYDTRLGYAEARPMEHLDELLREPDWFATALGSGSWDFWKGEEEDVYGPEDGRPL